jgi:hypothetical protein
MLPQKKSSLCPHTQNSDFRFHLGPVQHIRILCTYGLWSSILTSLPAASRVPGGAPHAHVHPARVPSGDWHPPPLSPWTVTLVDLESVSAQRHSGRPRALQRVQVGVERVGRLPCADYAMGFPRELEVLAVQRWVMQRVVWATTSVVGERLLPWTWRQRWIAVGTGFARAGRGIKKNTYCHTHLLYISQGLRSVFYMPIMTLYSYNSLLKNEYRVVIPLLRS